MATPSRAFQKIRADVLAATNAVPAGRMTTFKAIGDLLEIMPRHVAYLLATLEDTERARLPWHRVAGDHGVLSPQQRAKHGAEITRRLRQEGIAVDARGRIANWADIVWSWPVVPPHPGAPVRGPYADPRTPLLLATPATPTRPQRKTRPRA